MCTNMIRSRWNDECFCFKNRKVTIPSPLLILPSFLSHPSTFILVSSSSFYSSFNFFGCIDEIISFLCAEEDMNCPYLAFANGITSLFFHFLFYVSSPSLLSPLSSLSSLPSPPPFPPFPLSLLVMDCMPQGLAQARMVHVLSNCIKS